MLRLRGLEGKIVGAVFDQAFGAVVLEVDTPCAPPGAIGMTPTYQRDYPSGRYFMAGVEWEVPEPPPAPDTP